MVSFACPDKKFDNVLKGSYKVYKLWLKKACLA